MMAWQSTKPVLAKMSLSEVIGQLVAPLGSASDVLIGAGNTITKDCVQGDLALSRTEQRNIAKGFLGFSNVGSRGFLFLATHYFKKNLFRNSFLQGGQKPLKHNKPSFLFYERGIGGLSASRSCPIDTFALSQTLTLTPYDAS